MLQNKGWKLFAWLSIVTDIAKIGPNPENRFTAAQIQAFLLWGKFLIYRLLYSGFQTTVNASPG